MSSVLKKIGNVISKGLNSAFRVIAKAAPYVIAAAVIYYTAGAALAGAGSSAVPAEAILGYNPETALAAADTITGSMSTGLTLSSIANKVEAAWGVADKFITKHPYIAQAGFNVLGNLTKPAPASKQSNIHPDWSDPSKVAAAKLLINPLSQQTQSTAPTAASAPAAQYTPLITPKTTPTPIASSAPAEGVTMTTAPDAATPLHAGDTLTNDVQLQPLLQA